MSLRDLFDDVIRTEVLLWAAVDARLRADCDLPVGTLDVLRVIERTPDCRVQEVAEALGITVGGASQAVDRVERRGLCARRPNPKNRRSSVLELTPEGSTALEQALHTFDAELAARFSALSPPQITALGDALRTLRASLT
ncbi:MarR family winged helix-turn-helix transcriptional regulator [Cryptosporangium arvum]|uniref:MarR family winged helix-turn-helix transcriptional regulator n=1 Tax=Cryptosporangium arvum TaxID=80871 RepID=UPI0004B911F3|nr:MarR family transcriptional regulator [Cryptosporangium arvum]